MKVKEVNYQTMFPIAPYLNDRVGVVLELEPGEEMEDALNEAKERVHEWHKQANPHLYQEKKKINIAEMARACNGTDINDIKNKLDKSIVASSALNGKIYYTNVNEQPLTKEAPIEKRSNSIIESINTCTSLKTLESYKFIVKGKPDLQKAYDTKMKELTK